MQELRISARTAEKLRDKHDLEPEAIRASIENVGRLPFSWDYGEERGLRALVWTVVHDDSCLVVLYPAIGEDATVWNLGSAYRV